ncbi:MAG: metallopeptidase family protein [Polyangiaceae bacterium]
MSAKLPRLLHLPSGTRASLSEAAARRALSAEEHALEGPFAAALALLSAPGVLESEEGDPLDVYTLPLRDVHTLRAFLARAGHVPEEEADFTCENCGHPFHAAPSAHLAPGPFLDGELDDPELDAPFPFGEPQPIPRILLPAARPTPARAPSAAGRQAPARALPASGRPAPARALPGLRRRARNARITPRVADTVTFAERTAADAGPLFRWADASLSGRVADLRITPAIVTAMGIVALGAERRASVLAEALAAAPAAAWARVVELWNDAAYPRRLFGLIRCERCGARNDLDVPLARELDREPPPRGSPRAVAKGRPPFPAIDAFEAMVSAHAEQVYSKRGVRNIDLFIDTGVPHTDEGGEPLLGSYLPGGVDEITEVPRPPEVRIYYRTFESEYAADPTFDVESEIHETLDHEIEHHLHYLTGVDPLDAEERAAIASEERRRIGARESARRELREATHTATGFLRAWPLWIALLIAALLTWWSRS